MIIIMVSSPQAIVLVDIGELILLDTYTRLTSYFPHIAKKFDPVVRRGGTMFCCPHCL